MFYDDRLEAIDYDRPTDLVAISVETYTARRAYQIASEYRRRGVPVVMGGFHATLRPDEVGRFADSVVVGEAEAVLPELIEDYRHGTPRRVYRAAGRPDPSTVAPDRSLFRGKRYLPIRLVEFARGCRFRCEFCAVQAFHDATQTHRRVEHVIEELGRVRSAGRLVFFIDDNIVSDLASAKELMRALIPLRIRWVSQASINVAFDDEALSLMKRSGCQGLLVGFESLETSTLRQMNKGFNASHGGAPAALARFRRPRAADLRHLHLRLRPRRRGDLRPHRRVRAAAGAVHRRLQPHHAVSGDSALRPSGRRGAADLGGLVARRRVPLRRGAVPARAGCPPRRLAALCLAARRRFYGWPSIGRRLGHWVNLRDPLMAAYFVVVNSLHQVDVDRRHGLPLGDAGHRTPLLEVA